MPLVSGEFGTHREYFGKVLSCLSVLQMDAEQELITISLKIMKCTKLDVLHLYSAICMASEVLLVNHLYSAPSKGACGSAGWVSNTTHYDCCHYRRMQERNPFGRPAR